MDHPSDTVPPAGADPAGGTVWFGYQRVPVADKAPRVRAVFDSVARRYDLMNDLMSGGLHRLWKAALIDWLDPRPGRHLLDIAGGTGDIAFRYLARADSRPRPAAGSAPARVTPARVTVCDINSAMLAVGRARAFDTGRAAGPAGAARLAWVCGDAQALPVPDRSVDACTIAFGLRNVTDIDAALAEAHRVLAPGGRFACLEFGPEVIRPLDRLYDIYSFQVLPRLGQWVARDADSYRYLAESIRTFPAPAVLLDRMARAGLVRTGARPISGGIVNLHTGWRI